jgi:nicotinamidase/pyrazinamidase
MILMKAQGSIGLQTGDALIIVDVQNDFLPGGSLAVPYGDEVVPVLSRYIHAFKEKGLPIFATRDWHPSNHCSFKAQGGPWPPHCIRSTKGAEFAAGLQLPEDAVIISKAMSQEPDAYSGFDGTELHDRLQALGIKRLLTGGLATDYCVLSTVRDALSLGYGVYLLEDAIRAVNVHPDDGKKAEEKMIGLGAKIIKVEHIA